MNSNDMTDAADTEMARKLYRMLDTAGIPHMKLMGHQPCRTSEESRNARKNASGLETIGAKALVQKLYHRNKTSSIAIFVLRGDTKFDTRLALEHLNDVKRMRLLTADEVLEVTTLEIGSIPPFGPSLFPKVDKLFFDSALLDCDLLLGFNAASHQHSIIMSAAALASVATPNSIFPFSAAIAMPIAYSLFDELVEGRNYTG